MRSRRPSPNSLFLAMILAAIALGILQGAAEAIQALSDVLGLVAGPLT